MTVEKRLENALSISENIKDGKISPNNLYDLQLHLSDALEQVKKLTIPVVVEQSEQLRGKEEENTFDLWLKNFKHAGGDLYWYNEYTLYSVEAMMGIYNTEIKPNNPTLKNQPYGKP